MQKSLCGGTLARKINKSTSQTICVVEQILVSCWLVEDLHAFEIDKIAVTPIPTNTFAW